MTFSTDEAVRAYLLLMHELANRMDLVKRACDGHLNLTPPYAREYAYLQFRRMCELVALGCLQLHGDLPQAQTQSAKKEWNAEKIMKLLHNSHPHSFPQSVTRTLTEGAWDIKANSVKGALTRQEFKTLYSECGQILHRGTIRTIENEGPLQDEQYRKVLTWQTKTVNLMNEHLVGRAGGAGFYLVTLRTTSGFPECSIFSPNKAGEMHVATKRLVIS